MATVIPDQLYKGSLMDQRSTSQRRTSDQYCFSFLGQDGIPTCPIRLQNDGHMTEGEAVKKDEYYYQRDHQLRSALMKKE